MRVLSISGSCPIGYFVQFGILSDSGFCPVRDFVQFEILSVRDFVQRAGASISRNLWGVQLNNQNFFGKISRILFALLVIVDFVCIVRLYVAIAHLMQFFFFLVLSRLENKRTEFWKS